MENFTSSNLAHCYCLMVDVARGGGRLEIVSEWSVRREVLVTPHVLAGSTLSPSLGPRRLGRDTAFLPLGQ